MSTAEEQKQIRIVKIIFTSLFGIGVFAFDYFSQNFMFSAVLYFIFLLSGLVFDRRKLLGLFGVVAVLGIYLNYFISHPEGDPDHELIYRSFYSLMIGVATAILFLYIKYIIQPEVKQQETKRIVNENEQLLHALHNSALVSITDKDGIITYANETFCKISGYEESELIGHNHRILKSGKQSDGVFVGMWKAISTGLIWRGEICNKAKDGTFYWVYATIIPIRGVDGTIDKYVAVRFDITPLKNAEEDIKLKSKELERSNEELQKFAYVASHDLQEPLRMVSSYTQLLEKRYSANLDESAKEYIHYAVEGANRMQRLIKDLLEYSRVSTKMKPFEKVDCNKIIDDVKFNLQRIIEEKGAIIETQDLPVVMGDEGQLMRLFQNLIGNAIKFVADKPPYVSIICEEEPEKWKFSVIDNGIGIDEQYSERIFVIFQRLHAKEDFEGSGMGLAISKRIVERHKGEIWFEKNPEGGTRFIFTISKNSVN